MYNILHLADIHLGAVPYGIRARGEDIDRCLGDMTQLLVSQDIDAVVMAGDTFDHAQINPMDHSSLRALLSTATARGIPVYWIEGDHDSVRRDRVRRDGASWPEVFQESFSVFPEQLNEDGLPVPHVLEKAGHVPITICPINWRPGSEIKALMERIPDGYCSLMILHQSLEGVIPAIANPEIRISDIDRKASHFALGDLHINHETHLPSLAIAAYPGPIEWLSTDQAHHTGYRVICFGEDGLFSSTHQVRTRSRRLVRLIVGNGELINLIPLMPAEPWVEHDSEWIEVGSPGNSVRVRSGSRGGVTEENYFFDIRYFHSPTGESRQLAETVEGFLSSSFGGSLSRVSQIPSVDREDLYTEDSAVDGEHVASAMSMEEAIRQQCAEEEDPRILATALDIWAHPESIQTIIENQSENTETQTS